MYRLVAVGALLLLAVTGATASARFERIRTNMHESRVRGDWATFNRSAVTLVALLNGSPDALLDRARGEVRAGSVMEALRTLQTVGAMGQAPEAIVTLPDFAVVRQSAGYAALLSQMRTNAAPISHAKVATEIADPNLLPEDVDYDAAGDRFLLTSVLEKKIVAVTRGGAVTTFAASPDTWPMLAIKIDTRHKIVWATEVALDGFTAVRKNDWGRSALLAFNLHDGTLARRIEGPRPSALGDMALGADGALVVSDGEGGGVYVFRSGDNALKLVNGDDFISPQTPAFASRDTVLVPDYARGVGILHLSTGSVRWIPMSGRYALEGIDGSYLRGNTLIAVQNGTEPERVVTFSLTQPIAGIASESAIESGTPGLDPTHGVVIGQKFYYIANSGWNALDDNGNVKKGSSLTKPRLMVTSL